MKTIVTSVAAILLACSTAMCVEKSLSQLIGDLAVEDQGNNTCNTACGILVTRKEEAVPALHDALWNENGRVRYYAVRCLGQINTQAARSVLIDAFFSGASDVREHAAYALTWNPEQDAEKVYIEFLNGRDERHVRNAIKALGEIKSRKAVPHLIKVRDNPPGWHSYYTAVVALRKIEPHQSSAEIEAALDFLRRAKFARDVDMQRLNDSANIIRKNFHVTLADVFDIFLWVTKGNESTATPNAKTLLHEAGSLAMPIVRIGLNDPDENVSRKAKELVEEFETLETNLGPITKLTVTNLLAHKSEYKGKRVEVTGYYLSYFECSKLSHHQGDSDEASIWIHVWRVKPGHGKQIQSVSKGQVRVIGTFDYKEGGSGHFGMCPAEITELELFEPVK